MNLRDDIVWCLRGLFEVERKGYMVNVFTPLVDVYVWRPGQPFGLHIAYGLPYDDWRTWKVVE